MLKYEKKIAQNMQNFGQMCKICKMKLGSFYRKFSEMKKELGYTLNRAVEKNTCFHINPNPPYT